MMKTVVIAALFVTFLVQGAFSDTVIMSDGLRVKGVVVEEYSDRIVLSTIDGEKEILREDIRRIIYDLEEQNLTALGDHYLDQGRFERAYYYYDKALEVNPDYEKARAGLDYAGSHLQHRGRLYKLAHIRRRQEEARWSRGDREMEVRDLREDIARQLGIYFGDASDPFLITDIHSNSPASESDLAAGDRLASCWGRRVKYLPPDEVYGRLLRPGVMEVKLTVTREVQLDLAERAVTYAGFLGAELDYDMMQGLMVKSVREEGAARSAGLLQGDLVLGIEGESTRYMPEKEVHQLIRSRAGDAILLEIERAETLWKRFGLGS